MPTGGFHCPERPPVDGLGVARLTENGGVQSPRQPQSVSAWQAANSHGVRTPWLPSVRTRSNKGGLAFWTLVELQRRHHLRRSPLNPIPYIVHQLTAVHRGCASTKNLTHNGAQARHKKRDHCQRKKGLKKEWEGARQRGRRKREKKTLVPPRYGLLRMVTGPCTTVWHASR